MYHYRAEPTNHFVIKTTEYFAYTCRQSVDLLVYYCIPFDMSIMIYFIDVRDFENIDFLIM